MFSIKSDRIGNSLSPQNFLFRTGIIRWNLSFVNRHTSTFVDILYEMKIRRERDSRGYAMAKSIREIWQQTRIYTPHAIHVCARATELRQYQVSTWLVFRLKWTWWYSRDICKPKQGYVASEKSNRKNSFKNTRELTLFWKDYTRLALIFLNRNLYKFLKNTDQFRPEKVSCNN